MYKKLCEDSLGIEKVAEISNKHFKYADNDEFWQLVSVLTFKRNITVEKLTELLNKECNSSENKTKKFKKIPDWIRLNKSLVEKQLNKTVSYVIDDDI